MRSPRTEVRGELASKTARKLIARTYCATLALVAKILGAAFWFFEQRRSRLADLLDKERGAR